MHTVLIVSNEVRELQLLEQLLRTSYYCLTATSGEEASNLLDQHSVAVIIADQDLPRMTGLELLAKQSEHNTHMARILLTGHMELEVLVEAINSRLAFRYVSKPWKNKDMKLYVDQAVSEFERNKRQHALASINHRLNVRVSQMKIEFVRTIVSILKMSDGFTYVRGTRVSKYASVIAASFALHDGLFEDLTAACFLHELGLLAVSRLSKHSSDEAAEALSRSLDLRDVSDIVRFQHENVDGSGHPLGLFGDQIPIASRILRVASEYDALVNPRDRRQRIDHTSALYELRKCAGTKFDLDVVETLSRLEAVEMKELYQGNSVPATMELQTVAIN